YSPPSSALRASLSLLSPSLPCSPAHRHLPSFPTRRSSDLGGHAEAGVPVGDADAFPDDADVGHQRDDEPGSDGDTVDRRDDRLRSEEHTSELQSRENLVCRLLLEKKKSDTNAQGVDQQQVD